MFISFEDINIKICVYQNDWNSFFNLFDSRIYFIKNGKYAFNFPICTNGFYNVLKRIAHPKLWLPSWISDLWNKSVKTTRVSKSKNKITESTES